MRSGKVFRYTLSELEKPMAIDNHRETSWLYYVGDNLYEILFLSAALLTICGFIRPLKRRKSLRTKKKRGRRGNQPGLIPIQ